MTIDILHKYRIFLSGVVGRILGHWPLKKKEKRKEEGEEI